MSDHVEGPLLADYLLEWLECRADRLRPSTVRSYRQLITAYLDPAFGQYRLAELDRRGLEACYTALRNSGGHRVRGLSASTVGYVHSVLHRALQDAVVDGLLAINPPRLAGCRHRAQTTCRLTRGRAGA